MIQIRVLQRQQLSYPCYLFGFRDLTNQCAYVHFQHNAFFVIMCRITIKLFLYCQNPFHGEGFGLVLVMNSFMALTLCMIMLSYQLWVIWHVHLCHESDVLSWTVRSNVCCHTSTKKIFWPTRAVFSSKISLSKLHYSHITSNLLPHAWSIKCR